MTHGVPPRRRPHGLPRPAAAHARGGPPRGDRRRTGEVIEATPSGSASTRYRAGTGPRGQRGPVQSLKTDMRKELGVTLDESARMQALARIPEPVFDEYTDKVRNREGVPQGRGTVDHRWANRGQPYVRVWRYRLDLGGNPAPTTLRS